MANTFKNYTERNIGTSLTSVAGYTVPSATQTTVIGLTIANVTNSAVTATVVLSDGANETRVVKDAEILAGSSLVVVGGDQKLVLEPGDSVRVSSDTATALDVVMSVLEID